MGLKGLFLSIQTRLQSEIPDLRLVDLYKNQFEDTNNNDQEMNPQQAIPYPCVFISFPGDNEQVSAGGGVKQLDVLITIRLGFESYNLTPLEVFDLADQVELALDGYSDGQTFTQLTYVAHRVPIEITNVSIFEFDYKCIYQDVLCRRNRNDIIKTGSELNVTVNPVPSI